VRPCLYTLSRPGHSNDGELTGSTCPGHLDESTYLPKVSELSTRCGPAAGGGRRVCNALLGRAWGGPSRWRCGDGTESLVSLCVNVYVNAHVCARVRVRAFVF
jgi:hypothetical protein